MNNFHKYLLAAWAVAMPGALTANASEADPPGSFTYQVGKAIEFHPFNVDDFVNPDTGRAYLPNQPMQVKLNGQIKVYSSALEFVQTLNDAEKQFNRLGKSLRNGKIKLDAHTLTNPNVVLGELGSNLGISVERLKTHLRKAIDHCELVQLEDFNGDAQVSLPFGGTSTISLKDRKPMLVKDFVAKVNQQQRFLCQLGYSYVERAAAGSEDFVAGLLDKRQGIMADLGISDFHPVFDFSVLGDIQGVAKIAQEFVQVVQDLRDPTPARLYEMARNLPIPEALKLPEIPSIPSPVVPKRPDLRLKKKKTWSGLNAGSHDTMAVYANASLEINGSETQEEITGVGKAGGYILNKEINVIEGHIYMYAGSDSVNGEVHASFVGQDIYKKDVARQVAFHWGNDRDVVCRFGRILPSESDQKCDFHSSVPMLEINEKFWIGPVPAFVVVGIKGELGLGWNVGLTAVSAVADVQPFADVTAYGIAAAGIDGVAALGLSGEIKLITDKLVAQGKALIKFDDAGVPSLDISIEGYNTYTLLAGRVFAYVEVDAFAAVKMLLPGAVELVNSAVDAANKAADAVSHAANSVGDAVADICGWRQHLYVASLGGGAGYFSIGDLEKALTYYQEFDIYASHGIGGDKERFLNYHIAISPYGTTLDGDSVDNTDREEASHLDAVLKIDELENALAKLEHDIAQKKASVYGQIDKDLNATTALQVQQDPSAQLESIRALDGDRDIYLSRLATWSNKPI